MDISRNTMVLLCILLSLPGYAQYRVQIAAYGEAVPFNYFELLGLQEVDLSKDHNDIFRYYLPEQHTLEDAEQLQSEAMEKGFQYAQIIDLAAHRKRCANLCSPAPLPPLDDRKYKQMINFGFGGYQLSAFAKSELDVVSHILRERPEFTVRLMGHTDAIGSAGYNISLASRRVMESKHYLMGRGIGADRLKVKVYGESQPVALNRDAQGRDLPEGRKYNRRVEIQIVNETDQSIFRWKEPVVVPAHLRINPQKLLELSKPDPKTE